MWLYSLYYYSYRIITYLFWIYSLIIIALNFFYIEISKPIAYLFWLLLGLYLGYTLALQAHKYMQSKK